MAIAVALLIACIVGVAVSALVQLAITAEMEMRLGDPPNLTFWQLAGRGRSYAIQREFRQRYPGDRLNSKLRIAEIVFIAFAIVSAVVLFGFLPRWAPLSR
ncbi:MAG TPA: hypothetical protein VG225_16125 [Terracidiphilus sp.]|jgi:hypothetical protein|nr:hypothetical protein [Terracidiphilus sp.]